MTGGRLVGRLVVVGVTGSIAAYKSAELVRRLTDEGAEVQVLLSRSGQRFVGPLTFETLTRRRVMSDPLELLPDGRIGHIVAADAADVIVVAPATARWIAAMAAGLSDDVITATCLAASAPVIVAPAMDGDMYQHPATQANLERLRSFDYIVVPPESGALASGQRGIGRLAAIETIVDETVMAVGVRPVRAPDPAARPPIAEDIREPDLAGRHVVVSAGGTAEPIDPVRFIGNRSSGKMGAALVQAALARGARVTLIAGTIGVPIPEGAEVIGAETAETMRAAVLEATPGADVLVMAAAVADFRPAVPRTTKMERGERLILELEPTPDILAEVSRATTRRARAGLPRLVVVGFAAESGSLERAAGKLARKGVDLLMVNDVSEAGSGFGSDTNRVTVFGRDGSIEEWPMLPKREVADRILDRVAAILHATVEGSRADAIVGTEAAG